MDLRNSLTAFAAVLVLCLGAGCAAADDPFETAPGTDALPPSNPGTPGVQPPTAAPQPTGVQPPTATQQPTGAQPPTATPQPTGAPTPPVAGAPAPPTPVADARKPVCVDDPNTVAMIGDSYVNFAVTHTFPADIAAASGQTWPLYAVPGSSMASGGVAGFIPDQFRGAIAANPGITTVVMNGGGNDILIPDQIRFPGSNQCTASATSSTLEVCQMVVDAAIETSQALMLEAAEAGVTEIFFFFYPHLPGPSNPGANPMLDYSVPLAREACESVLEITEGRLRCTFLDTIPTFEGMTGVFSGDNIHLNTMGSKVLADAVWQGMQDACVSQPSSSGCCEPAL